METKANYALIGAFVLLAFAAAVAFVAWLSNSEFDQLILDLRDAMDLTVLMVTHDLDSLYAICDEVAVLLNKTIGAYGPLSEVSQVDDPWVREYFGGPRARAALTAKERNRSGAGGAGTVVAKRPGLAQSPLNQGAEA